MIGCLPNTRRANPDPPPLFAPGWPFERSTPRNPCVYRHFRANLTCPFPGQTWSYGAALPSSSSAVAVSQSARWFLGVFLAGVAPRAPARSSPRIAESGARLRRRIPTAVTPIGTRCRNAADDGSKAGPGVPLRVDLTKGSSRAASSPSIGKRDNASRCDFLLVTQLSRASASGLRRGTSRDLTWSGFHRGQPPDRALGGESSLCRDTGDTHGPGLFLPTPSVTPSRLHLPSPPMPCGEILVHVAPFRRPGADLGAFFQGIAVQRKLTHVLSR